MLLGQPHKHCKPGTLHCQEVRADLPNTLGQTHCRPLSVWPFIRPRLPVRHGQPPRREVRLRSGTAVGPQTIAVSVRELFRRSHAPLCALRRRQFCRSASSCIAAKPGAGRLPTPRRSPPRTDDAMLSPISRSEGNSLQVLPISPRRILRTSLGFQILAGVQITSVCRRDRIFPNGRSDR